jgi:methylmalonyl-CoA mutase
MDFQCALIEWFSCLVIRLTSESILNKLQPKSCMKINEKLGLCLGENMNTKKIEKRISTIVQREGRRPRILLAHLERDQSDRWTKPLAASLAEFGFDVDIGPGNQAPIQSARLAIDNDVHVMCVSIVEITNQLLVVQLAAALQAHGGADIRLVAGGVGVQPNHKELYRAGVDLIVDFDKSNVNLIDGMLDLLEENGGKRMPYRDC